MKKSIEIESTNGIDYFKNTLRMVKAAGFEAVGIDISASTANSLDFEGYVSRLREALDENDLSCSQIHLPFYDLLKSSEVKDDAMENAIRNSFKGASLLGARWCVYHPRTSISSGYDWRKSFCEAKEDLAGLLEVAVKHDVGISIENIPIFPDCPMHRFYCSDPDDLCELTDSFDSQWTSVCWDTGHANLMSFDQPKVIRQMGKRIKTTHIHSNFKEQDWHLLPVFGRIDWEKIMKAFWEIGFDGDLNLEVASVHSKARESFYRLAYDSVTILKETYDSFKS